MISSQNFSVTRRKLLDQEDQPEAMDKDFRACAVCTSTCFKEHGADTTQQSAPYTRLPCFLLPSVEGSTNWAPLPREFVEGHGEALRGTARILGANGKEWSVEIGGPAKLLGFKGGWKNFVASTSAKRGDQMLFSLISKSCFSVHMFNKLGVEVVPAPPVDTKYTTTPTTGKRKRLEVKPEPVSDDESDDDSSDSDMSEYEASKSDAESPSEFDTGVEPIEDEGILSKPRKRVKRKYTGSSTRGKTASKPNHKKKVRANITKEGIYIEPGSCTTTYESRRREVTRAELDRTMERARALETEFPSIPVLMMPSHVYRGFWLTIPGKFSKEFMPQEKKEVKLKDEHGFEWPATWIRSDKHTGLSGGWAAFSKDHCLEEGDVCVFEVTKSKDWTIIVHIFRVVEVDLKPGTIGGWEKTYNIVHGALMHQPGVAKKFKNRKSATVKKSGSKSTVKSSTVKSTRKKVAEDSDSEESGEEGSDVEEDDVPLTSLYKEKWSSDVTSEEVDVKPKIVSMRPIPKITKVKQESGLPLKVKQEPGLPVKVKQEPGLPVKVKQEPVVVPVMCGVKRENGIHCGDVKPTVQELRASLSRASSVTTASFVKPEPVDSDGKVWHPIIRLLGKRQSPKSPDQHDFLVNLGPRVICTSASGCATEDGNGNWWVPRSQFSSDLASCYID